MVRRASIGWALPALAIALSLLGMSFVLGRTQASYDGARLEPGQRAWLPEGLLVSPLTATTEGLRPGDLVTAVGKTGVDDWAQSILRPGSRDLEAGLGKTTIYSAIRAGRPLKLQATHSTYPLAALLMRYWGIYVVVLVLQIMMTFVLIRRPEEEAARSLFVFAWSLWHFPAWTMGLQVGDLLSGWGYWHYRLATWLPFLLTFSALLHTGLVFPHRHPILDRYPRLLAAVYLAPYAMFGVYMALARPASTSVWTWLGRWNAGEWTVSLVYVLLLFAVSTMNYRRVRDGSTRARIRWVLFGWSLSAVGIVLFWMLPGAVMGQPLIPAAAIALLALPVPTALALAILRHQLFDIDTVINRALVYAALTVVIVAVYVVIVGYVGALFHTQASDHARSDIIFSLGAAALVAIIFHPLRAGLQRLANHLLYGERDDPYAVLAGLGQKLETAGSVETTLPTIVQTIAQALRLPYVAIEFKDGSTSRLAAAYGAPQAGHAERYPLIHQGAVFGELVLAQRSAAESFNPNELRLLADLAREVEVAAHNVRLTADLQRSREALVTSQEEERRRIRRDLHDEIGPLLASQSLTLEAIEKLIVQDPAAAASLVRDLKGQTQTAVQEIRRIIYDLRPPALEDFGLLEALRERLAHSGDGRLTVIVDAPKSLPPLSAAVETAVYRIAVEAVTNVVRHAHASECRVKLRLNGALWLEISDDGTGLPESYRLGVGLRAMRERAEELGGTFHIERLAEIGTHLLITLPVSTESG